MLPLGGGGGGIPMASSEVKSKLQYVLCPLRRELRCSYVLHCQQSGAQGTRVMTPETCLKEDECGDEQNGGNDGQNRRCKRLRRLFISAVRPLHIPITAQ